MMIADPKVGGSNQNNMEINIDNTVTVKKGDLEFRMGKRLTSFYYKGVEKFVFRTEEATDVVSMLQKAKETLDAQPNSKPTA